MTAVLYVLGVVVFLLGLAFSIAWHELGHLLPAKRFGVRCTQYMIGFGPTVWSRTVRGTEYGLKAIPLGGYVRMIGMLPPRADGTPSRRPSRFGTMIEDARRDAFRDIGPEDGDRLFYQRSVPKRLVIMLGGPVMNLILAFVIFAGVVTLYGINGPAPVVASVSQCVLPADTVERSCPAGAPRTPAAEAGLRQGDRFTAYDGHPVTSWAQIREAIRANPGTSVTLQVERAGQPLTLHVTPVLSDVAKLDANGEPVLDPNGKLLTEKAGFLGITPAAQRERQSLAVVPGVVGGLLKSVGGALLSFPEKLVGVAKAVLGLAPRDSTGPVGIIGMGRAAGEIATEQGGTGIDHVAWLASLLGGLNLALFAFNLIPLLPLDGGHVAGALWEALRRGVARLRRLPDPGPVDIARMVPLTYVVWVLLVGMTLLIGYADIVKPIGLGG